MCGLTGQEVRDWAPAASAGFAFLAATASWASVRLNHRQWRQSRMPNVHAQMWHKQKTNRIELVILNAGPGVARGVGFCVVLGDEYVAGFAGPNMGGFLNPGERVVVETDFTAGNVTKYEGVVTCDDVLGRFHSWAIHPVRHRVWRTKFLRRPLNEYPSGETVLRYHHPQHDLATLRRVQGQTPARQFGALAGPQP
jgi:hypothetical protein